MKTKIRKFVLPMVVVLIAIAGAFAGNFSPQGEAEIVDRLGHTVTCQPTAIMCSTQGTAICTDGASNVLYDWNGTNCPLPLKRKFN